jgi:hypothetical protein
MENVKSMNEYSFVELTLCKAPDPSHGDVFPYPATICEQTKHDIQKFSAFCIK